MLYVSNKNKLVEISKVEAGYALDVVIENTTIYVASGHSGVFVIDVKDSAVPKFLSKFEISGSAAGIDVKDELIYVVNMDDDDPALSIIDVSNKEKLKRISKQKLIYGAERVRIEGNLVYVAGVANDAGLIVIDVENPLLPKKLGSWWHPTCSESVFIADKVAYLAHGDQGLEILDISNPNELVVTEHFAAAGRVRNFDVENNMTFLANGYRGLKIVDTSNKSDLKTISEIKTYRALDVEVVGDYAHIADDWAGYKLIDISNIQEPKIVAELKMSGYAEDLLVINDLVFIANGKGGLRIISVKEPNSPKEISGIEFEGGYAYEVAVKAVKGSYAYVATGKAGLMVVNISNPLKPVIESSYLTEEPYFEAFGVTVRDNLVYFSSSYPGVKIIDVSNAKKLVQVGSYKTQKSAKHLSLKGNLAYVVDLDYMRVLDVSNPQQPRKIAEKQLPAMSAKIYNDTDKIYVAGMEAGLLIYDD